MLVLSQNQTNMNNRAYTVRFLWTSKTKMWKISYLVQTSLIYGECIMKRFFDMGSLTFSLRMMVAFNVEKCECIDHPGKMKCGEIRWAWGPPFIRCNRELYPLQHEKVMKMRLNGYMGTKTYGLQTWAWDYAPRQLRNVKYDNPQISRHQNLWFADMHMKLCSKPNKEHQTRQLSNI